MNIRPCPTAASPAAVQARLDLRRGTRTQPHTTPKQRPRTTQRRVALDDQQRNPP